VDKIVVSSIGAFIVAGIYWFFFGNKKDSAEALGSVTIIVEGGYKPKNIKIPKNQTTSLIFLRKDTNTCLEELVLPDFKIKKYLPVHKPITITLSPKKLGTYNFHCGMNMFHGTIEVTS
jgi:plastocyanin domain-containing protein